MKHGSKKPKLANTTSDTNFFSKNSNPNSGMNHPVDVAKSKGKGSYKAKPPKIKI